MKLARVKVFNSVKAGDKENVSLASPEFKLELIGQLIQVIDKDGKIVYVPLTNVPYFIPLDIEEKDVKEKDERTASKSSVKRNAPKNKAKAKVARSTVRKTK